MNKVEQSQKSFLTLVLLLNHVCPCFTRLTASDESKITNKQGVYSRIIRENSTIVTITL